jgi:putative heme-binding domain-containing protein
MKGDASRGRELFANAAGLQCRNCHRIGELGRAFGADLNDVGKRYQRRELLESLIDPSRKIDPKYMTYVLVNRDGKIFTGLLLEKTDQEVVLNVLNDGKPEPVRIPAAEVEELVPQSKSLMPDRQLRDLTAQQAADLLEYLSSLK